MEDNLDRFMAPQNLDYPIALEEIRSGRKRSHWIWYIFPQLKGLGFSHHAEYYGVTNLTEAAAYLRHPVLGKRLVEISCVLLELPCNDASKVMGYPDDVKLQSSMTLFASVPGTDPVFEKVLQKFFLGKADLRTRKLCATGQPTGSASS